MLVNNVLRPVASNLLKVPSRSTSAVVGARSRHVSIPVSVSPKIVNIFIFCHLIGDFSDFSSKKDHHFTKANNRLCKSVKNLLGKNEFIRQ